MFTCPECNRAMQSRKYKGKCTTCYSRQWRAENRERYLKWKRKWYSEHQESVRNSRLLVGFGITLEQYRQMAASQNGKCAICHRERTLCVDHDHSTGKIRALLCHCCNKALGNLQDSADICLKAAEYLRSHDEGK